MRPKLTPVRAGAGSGAGGQGGEERMWGWRAAPAPGGGGTLGTGSWRGSLRWLPGTLGMGNITAPVSRSQSPLRKHGTPRPASGGGGLPGGPSASLPAGKAPAAGPPGTLTSAQRLPPGCYRWRLRRYPGRGLRGGPPALKADSSFINWPSLNNQRKRSSVPQ
uniref:Uncharacterized protein n=1 Tax=Myotis myotis TaxID=51298 RepID=A0A7J7Y052_MYOMY|nr:hypothetical protein mMyoMyo1_011385 [Myotis myotis]